MPIKETKMFKNRFILILAVFSLLLVTIAVSRPFGSAPTAEELNWPARPVIAPVTGSTELSDFAERHANWNAEVASVGIPVTGAIDLSDYYLRLESMKSADASDYILRHPELRIVNNTADMSDYYIRHPEALVATTAANMDDYYLRLTANATGNSAIDTSDYFLRH